MLEVGGFGGPVRMALRARPETGAVVRQRMAKLYLSYRFRAMRCSSMWDGMI